MSVELLPRAGARADRRVLKSNRIEHVLDVELNKRFEELTRVVGSWSKETIGIVRPYAHREPSESRKLNQTLERNVSSKWSIEILSVLHPGKSARFEELRKACKGISSRILSRKLKMMENDGLVKRKILATRPPRALYMLTEKGLTLTTLGTPIVLFVRFKEGRYSPQSSTR